MYSISTVMLRRCKYPRRVSVVSRRINSCVGQANHRSFVLTLSVFLLTSVHAIGVVLRSLCPQQYVVTALLYCPGVYSQSRYSARKHLSIIRDSHRQPPGYLLSYRIDFTTSVYLNFSSALTKKHFQNSFLCFFYWTTYCASICWHCNLMAS